jgi:diguanylate cyclase (GGDEF)-like protein
LPYVIEYQITDKQGQVKWVWEKGTGVYDDKGQIIALEGFISDITERKMAEERFHYLAHYDSLTGLANRTLFFDRLHQAMRMAKRGGHLLALLFLDLDGFKFINDTYGHDAGDVVLKETAKRLLENVRESDTVARMGGDEFTVILPSIENKKGAAIVAQKIIRAISEPYAIFNEQCAMSASIGISIYYGGEEDTDTLIKKADIAMYRAKQSGKNCFAFYTA